MACDEFVGCLLTSFGIPIVLVLFTIITHPLRIITLIISSSFWLVSFLISSILWFAVVPLRDKLAFGLVFSVLFQEAIRLLFVYCLQRLDRAIKLIVSDFRADDSCSTDRDTVSNQLGNDHLQAPDSIKPLIDQSTPSEDIFNVTTFAYVGGLGFGLISGLFATLNLLVALNGPGTLGYYGQSEQFINLYAGQTLVLVLMHVAATVVMSRALQMGRQHRYKIALVTVIRLATACLTLANSRASPAPELVLGANATACFALIGWAFWEAGGRPSRIPWAVGLNRRRLARFLAAHRHRHRRPHSRPDTGTGHSDPGVE